MHSGYLSGWPFCFLEYLTLVQERLTSFNFAREVMLSIFRSREEASSQQPLRARCHDIAMAALLAVFVFLGFNANLRSIPAGDTYAARYLPFSFLLNRSVVLDPIVATVAQGRRAPTVQGKGDTAYWIRKGRGDHFISLYPITVPLVIAPLYLPAVIYLDANGWDPLLFDRVARIMEKLSAYRVIYAIIGLLMIATVPKEALIISLRGFSRDQPNVDLISASLNGSQDNDQ